MKMLTNSGQYIDMLSPSASQIRIEDIAHGLSKLCRFGGQCSVFFSVAEHSLNVADDIMQHSPTRAVSKELGLSALKELLPDYCQLEDHWALVIGRALGVQLTPLPIEVKEADRRALYYEHRLLFPNDKEQWSAESKPEYPVYPALHMCNQHPGVLRRSFLREYESLGGKP